MTANQIEYQKLQETRRHNLETEGYERPLKQAQTAESYASIGLLRAQTETQKSVQAANLASAAASYASAEASRATAARQYEAVNTERSQQELNRQKAAESVGIQAYNQARTSILEPDVTRAGIKNQMYNDNLDFQYYLTMVDDFNTFALPYINAALGSGFSGAGIIGR